MTGIGAAYSSRSDFDSVSETPAPKNIDPDLASEATAPIDTPVEPEASSPKTEKETAKASPVVKEPVATADSQPQDMDSKTAPEGHDTAGEKDSKPVENPPEPAEEKAKSLEEKAQPVEKVSKSVEKDPEPAEKAAKPAEKAAKPAPKPKPPKPEDKPFPEFIDKLFLPAVVEQLKSNDITAERLERVDGDRPVVGGSCPMVIGELPGGRRFWLCFAKADINSQKVIALADPGSEPTLLESFLIDEKRTSLPLLVSRLLQRLNGQKWLGGN